MHQTNHLAKTGKNAFDKAINQLLAELALTTTTLSSTLLDLRSNQDPEIMISRIEQALRKLSKMQDNRG